MITCEKRIAASVSHLRLGVSSASAAASVGSGGCVSALLGSVVGTGVCVMSSVVTMRIGEGLTGGGSEGSSEGSAVFDALR